MGSARNICEKGLVLGLVIIWKESGGTTRKRAEVAGGLGVLMARSDPAGTRWFRVRDDGGGHGKEDLWKRTWIGTDTGYMVSIFGGWGNEPGGRRLTKPMRERERERFKITRRLPERASRSQKARTSFNIIAFIFSTLLVGFVLISGYGMISLIDRV